MFTTAAAQQLFQAGISKYPDEDNWTITTDDGDFVQAATTTPLMRYRDDVMLSFDREENLIQVRSSSRLDASRTSKPVDQRSSIFGTEATARTRGGTSHAEQR